MCVCVVVVVAAGGAGGECDGVRCDLFQHSARVALLHFGEQWALLQRLASVQQQTRGQPLFETPSMFPCLPRLMLAEFLFVFLVGIDNFISLIFFGGNGRDFCGWVFVVAVVFAVVVVIAQRHQKPTGAVVLQFNDTMMVQANLFRSSPPFPHFLYFLFQRQERIHDGEKGKKYQTYVEQNQIHPDEEPRSRTFRLVKVYENCGAHKCERREDVARIGDRKDYGIAMWPKIVEAATGEDRDGQRNARTQGRWEPKHRARKQEFT